MARTRSCRRTGCCLDACGALRDEMTGYAEIELAEPNEDDVALVRKLIEKASGG